MVEARGEVRRRLASWGWDYLVVLGWLVVVTVAVGIPTLLGWIDLASVWSRPIAADLVIGLLTVVPYLAYLIVTEAGVAQASLGKRRLGLLVRGIAGEATGLRVVTRNTVKVVPWQLGHMSAMRFAATDTEPPRAAVIYFVLSTLLLAWIVAPVLLGRRGVHDRLAGTEVVSRGATGWARA